MYLLIFKLFKNKNVLVFTFFKTILKKIEEVAVEEVEDANEEVAVEEEQEVAEEVVVVVVEKFLKTKQKHIFLVFIIFKNNKSDFIYFLQYKLVLYFYL